MEKMLKVVSIIMIVLAIIALVFEVLALVGLGALSLFGEFDMGALIGGMAIGLIDAVLMLIAGIIGNKASKTGNTKICFIFAIIIIALAVVSIAMTAVGGQLSWVSFIELVLPVLYFIPAIKLRK